MAESSYDRLNSSVNLDRLEMTSWASKAYTVGAAWFALSEFSYASDNDSSLATKLGWLGVLQVVLGVTIVLVVTQLRSIVLAILATERDRNASGAS